MTDSMMRWKLMMLTAFLFLLLSACQNGGQDKTELVVAAASSLQDVMDDAEKAFTDEHPDTKITLNYGASGSLQQQIAQGAPVDVFISASDDRVERLIRSGQMTREDTENILRNRIVLITPARSDSSITNLEDAVNSRWTITAGVPASVPAGRYAKEALEYYGYWNNVQDHLVQAKNVRQVLTYVENKNADAGFVYKTDAMVSDDVQIVQQIEQRAHSPIVYPAGIISDSQHKQAAGEFLEFLTGKKMAGIASEYGFETETNK
ncbi:molybdate ABC transporter substrate-binding protein [Salibacterium halotolerans]|uniref:Molybdate transport system substrate-binding protein n=1 Tax=Salibacterium halotolerans TaxID=1884432 RepID=A0A1I5QGK8_9BACI|nr:molybdate ABC transporter substrate-binding protein [Salibacterium halotolerans]SFP45130.1 molybdate transport system substrate-binding protein [Salibacterium halotolerans]